MKEYSFMRIPRNCFTIKRKAICFVIMTSCLICSWAPVFAMTARQVGDNTIEISGTLENATTVQQVSVEVYVDGKELSSTSGGYLDVLKYHDQKKSAKDGSYSFLIALDPNDASGLFRIRLATSGPATIDTDNYATVVYSSPTGRQKAFELLYSDPNVLACADNFQSFVQEKRYDLVLTHPLNQLVNEAEAVAVLYPYVKGRTIATPAEFKIAYDKSLMIQAIKTGAIENVFTFLTDEMVANETLKIWYQQDFFTETAQKDATTRLHDMNAATIEEFDDQLVQAWLLALVRYPNGYGNLESALYAFEDMIGVKLSESTAPGSVCRTLAGQNISDLEKLKEELRRLITLYNNDSGGNKQSSGGIGSKTVSSSTAQAESVLQPIPISVFKDVATSHWAAEAIVSLAEKGVVNGKTPELFYPDDQISREEFVKMLVLAFLQNQPEKELDFSDISNQAWYSSYVQKAVNADIVRGISNSLFGIGEPIIRQDMAVMVYRTAIAAKIQITNASGQSNAFSDDSSISDYAREAIYALRNGGVVKGVSENEFEPGSFVTRAQAAVIIHNLMKF